MGRVNLRLKGERMKTKAGRAVLLGIVFFGIWMVGGLLLGRSGTVAKWSSLTGVITDPVFLAALVAWLVVLVLCSGLERRKGKREEQV